MLPFEVFLNDKSISKIVSFVAVVSKFRITIDPELDPFMYVHLHNGTRIIFKQFGGGPYIFDTTNKSFSKYQTTYYTFLNTVERKK